MTTDAARWATYHDKVDQARRELEQLPLTARYDPDRMTPGMAVLDKLYEQGGILRSRDPVIRRLRRAQTRSAASAVEEEAS